MTQSGPAPEQDPYAPPTANLEHPGNEGLGVDGARFSSLEGLSKAITIAMGALIAVEAVNIVNDLMLVDLMGRVVQGSGFTAEEGEALDARGGLLAGGAVLGHLVVAVLFCFFMPRANRNARAFGATTLEFTPKWAAGVFFVPLVNLYKPYRAMTEVWKAAETDPRTPWQYVPAPGLLAWWWGLYLAHNAAAQIVMRTSKDDPTAEQLITHGWLDGASSAITIAAGVLAVLVVRDVARRHAARAGLTRSSI